MRFVRVALVHPHVLEDLRVIGVRAEAYDRYAGYEHRYARLLNQRGVDADLLLFSRSSRAARVVRHAWGHEVVLVPLRGARFLRHLKTFGSLLGLVRRYDVVHCFSYYSNVFDVLAVACRFAGVPLVAQAQGIYPTISGPKRLRKLLTLRLAARLMPLNKREKEFLARRFGVAGDRVVVVPNFVVPDDHVPVPKEEARRSIGVSMDAFVVLTVCRLVPEKGVQTILQAMSELRGEVPNGLLLVVGEGPYRGALERMAEELRVSDRSRFVGYVPNQEISPYYSAADCFVLASLEESFPFVLLEAMLYGLPVVSTRTWGPSEIVVDGETGLLFEPSDPQGLARAIKQLYGDPAAMKRLGEAGRRRVLEKYTQDVTFRVLMRVYEEAGK